MKKVLVEVYLSYIFGEGESLVESYVETDTKELREELIDEWAANAPFIYSDLDAFEDGSEDVLYVGRSGRDWEEPTGVRIVLSSYKQKLLDIETKHSEELTKLHKQFFEEERKLNELVKKVEEWSIDKGLDVANPKSQFLKVAEEFGEIGAAMARNDIHELKDAIGDVIVTLIILALQNGTDVETCLEQAYGEISGRKGKMVDGVFIKSSDLDE